MKNQTDTVKEGSNKESSNRGQITLSKNFVPRVISWNITSKCNLKCAHCYMDSNLKRTLGELNTSDGKALIDQIVEVSLPMLILSGGEPLLRADVFDISKYATDKGLRVVMGTNGTLITDRVAKKLSSSGIKAVAISIDSKSPEQHDKFRGIDNAWELAINGIKACIRNNVEVQINTTVTKQNYDEIDGIMKLGEKLGASHFHLFFLVSTGRGIKVKDISPIKYEKKIREVLEKSQYYKLNVRPTCAPQFMRIAKQMGYEKKNRWSRGCMAGLNYCRIFPTGEVTPCPYLPIRLGNIKERNFRDIWFNSKILLSLRNFDNLKGRCGICEFKSICGGCRARAYGLTTSFSNICGSLHDPTELKGDYLAEDPCCTYNPNSSE